MSDESPPVESDDDAQPARNDADLSDAVSVPSEAATADHDAETDVDGDGNSDEEFVSPDLPPEEELKETGKKQFARVFDDQSGPDAKRAKQARQVVEQKFRQVAQKHEEAVQQAKQHQQSAADLEQTQDHIEAIAADEDDDRLVLRDWPGGITTEVYDDELSDAASSLAEMRSQYEQAAEQAKSQATQYAELREVLKHAHEEGKRMQETFDMAGGGDGGQRGGGQQRGRQQAQNAPGRQGGRREQNGDTVRTMHGDVNLGGTSEE